MMSKPGINRESVDGAPASTLATQPADGLLSLCAQRTPGADPRNSSQDRAALARFLLDTTTALTEEQAALALPHLQAP